MMEEEQRVEEGGGSGIHVRHWQLKAVPGVVDVLDYVLLSETSLQL